MSIESQVAAAEQRVGKPYVVVAQSVRQWQGARPKTKHNTPTCTAVLLCQQHTCATCKLKSGCTCPTVGCAHSVAAAGVTIITGHSHSPCQCASASTTIYTHAYIH